MNYHDSMKRAIDRQMTDDPDWASVYYRTKKKDWKMDFMIKNGLM